MLCMCYESWHISAIFKPTGYEITTKNKQVHHRCILAFPLIRDFVTSFKNEAALKFYLISTAILLVLMPFSAYELIRDDEKKTRSDKASNVLFSFSGITIRIIPVIIKIIPVIFMLAPTTMFSLPCPEGSKFFTCSNTSLIC